MEETAKAKPALIQGKESFFGVGKRSLGRSRPDRNTRVRVHVIRLQVLAPAIMGSGKGMREREGW